MAVNDILCSFLAFNSVMGLCYGMVVDLVYLDGGRFEFPQLCVQIWHPGWRLGVGFWFVICCGGLCDHGLYISCLSSLWSLFEAQMAYIFGPPELYADQYF